ncbi:hypothetical protein N0V93_001018 [Gnomoniopsis smithogilvyi]|uniref:Anaphase-promoting complex subunit 2 n=1 Tax=Gnomoniopsis smithogilvyi TaxID=1191159 RepID=A0A9W8Z2R4_9PEZI|nr:hypothetical protein N0V93_001018 [Gnomoniopsis smithogilvyi]
MATLEAAPISQWKAKRRRVFLSVFQGETSRSQPLSKKFSSRQEHGSEGPSTTQSAFLANPLVPQAIFIPSHSEDVTRSAEEQAQLEYAWPIVTETLQWPSFLLAQDADGTVPPVSQFGSQDEESEFNVALQLVIQDRQTQLNRGTRGGYDILAWYNHQVHRHFMQHVFPRLAELAESEGRRSTDADAAYCDFLGVIRDTIQLLEAALSQYYLPGLSVIVRAIEEQSLPRGDQSEFDAILARFTRDMHALITNSADPLFKSLSVVLDFLVGEALQVPKTSKKHHIQDNPRSHHVAADIQLIDLVKALNQVGLAGERFQVLFAEAMDRKMTQYIHRSFARVWKSATKSGSDGLGRNTAKSVIPGQTSSCIASLCDWVEDQCGRVALLVLTQLDQSGGRSGIVSLADIQQWKEIAIGRLAALRISELFDIVLQWPASRGALDDLKASVTTPQRRWELTTAFSAALQRRLLHPARSTIDILRFYVSMIRTFHALDHSKVLLSRVVPSLQLYLVQREDAVRMVVKGLLASPEEVERAQKAPLSWSDIDSEGSSRGPNGKLVELAILLNDPDQQRRTDIDEDDLDWDDMEWVPDPVDAGVNYKRPRSEDVIGTLINTLGSEDAFVKEFQNIIAEHLLSTQTDFTQEQKLLDLLKKRFSEASVQNCEVMIKDIYDSRKVDTHIRRIELGQPAQPPKSFGTPSTPPAFMDLGKQLDMDEEMEGQVPYHARILSRLYWPDIVEETFELPQPVAAQQRKYEMGYERLKSARKLTWLQQLGQATVELELEDRTINMECKTFEAAVIYAFQDDEEIKDVGTSPFHLSVQDLQERLHMDEELVIQALDFWLFHEVLTRYSTDPDTYTVLERKDSPPMRPELHPSISAPAALEGEHELSGMPPKPAGVKRAGTTSAMDAKENELRAVYWQFIVGMLTNNMGMMPLNQMGMMLRMVIPGGLPWSDQELQEFLMEKVELGEMEVVGGKYKLTKK